LLAWLSRAAVFAGARGSRALDTRALRMTFPCSLTLRLRNRRTVELRGGESRGRGQPVPEHRKVLERKWPSWG